MCGKILAVHRSWWHRFWFRWKFLDLSRSIAVLKHGLLDVRTIVETLNDSGIDFPHGDRLSRDNCFIFSLWRWPDTRGTSLSPFEGRTSTFLVWRIAHCFGQFKSSPFFFIVVPHGQIFYLLHPQNLGMRMRSGNFDFLPLAVIVMIMIMDVIDFDLLAEWEHLYFIRFKIINTPLLHLRKLHQRVPIANKKTLNQFIKMFIMLSFAKCQKNINLFHVFLLCIKIHFYYWIRISLLISNYIFKWAKTKRNNPNHLRNKRKVISGGVLSLLAKVITWLWAPSQIPRKLKSLKSTLNTLVSASQLLQEKVKLTMNSLDSYLNFSMFARAECMWTKEVSPDTKLLYLNNVLFLSPN